MPIPALPATLFVFSTYLALSSVSFAPFFFGQTLEQPIQTSFVVLISWLAAWTLFKKPAWFHWLLLPAFLALPTELYLRAFYNQGISTHHLGIILETSPRESIEFLGDKIWLLLGIMFLVTIWWMVTWIATRRATFLNWNHRSRWIVLVALFLFLSIWAYGRQYGVSAAVAGSNEPVASTAEDEGEVPNEPEAPASSSPGAASSISELAGKPRETAAFGKLPSWAKIPLDPEVFGSTWPFGLAIRAYDFWNERQYLGDLSRKSSLFRFGAYQVGHAVEPQIVVMVIGESSRFDRWSLNGYARKTNPLLSNEQNLVTLSDVVTSVSATRLSVPVLLSRKPATQSLKDGFSEKSFLTAFKEAGFKTYWISNQMSSGQFDTPVSVFAKEANIIQFMNLGGFTNASNFDQILLDPLQSAIRDPSLKKLIVLHTLGNHWNYSHRHPKNFDKWQPSLFGVDKPVYTDLKIKPRLNNSYDNSILYTDWFLAQVIGLLKVSNQMTSLLYVADHGQTLYDGNCNLAFHGHNTQYEFHVPSFVWYSDLYQTANLDKIKSLRKNRKARLSTENVFHSLLDLADIRYQTEHLDWSFLSRKFKQHKRYVDSYGWTNYDNAIIKGDCREVVDKGRPLAQEK